jgi:hypothetical protein
MANGWVTWLPLVVAAAVGLAVCAVLFDVSGVGGRLVPGHRAFVARLPRALERLWRGTVLVAVGELVLTAALLHLGSDWLWLVAQVWTVSAPALGLSLAFVAVTGGAISAFRTGREQRAAQKDGAGNDRAVEPLAQSLGAASARALRSPTGRALLRHGDRVIRAVRAGLTDPAEEEATPRPK